MTADLTPRMLPSDARRLRSELSAGDRAWRAGWEAAKRDRWWRRVPTTAWVVGGLVALWVLVLHRPHPLRFLVAFAATFGALCLLPVLVTVHAVHTIVVQHKVHRSWRRTAWLSAVWGAGLGGIQPAPFLPAPSPGPRLPSVSVQPWLAQVPVGADLARSAAQVTP
jgi:hypothetical protein